MAISNEYDEKDHSDHVSPERSAAFAKNGPMTAQEHSMADFAHINQAEVLRKMDMRLLPMLALLYLLAFLDRGNIGNARLEGLETDLKLKGNQYNLCLTVFFFSYAAFEIPSNLVLKKIRPSIWLPTIMVAWGVVMTLMGLTQSYHGLIVARFFLGVAEAGLYPGCAYFITLWYCRTEAQVRQALFFSAASIAGAFSGLLAYAIAKMDGVAGYHGWRWIFILEGILTVVVACLAFFCLHDSPETAKFLTEDERAWVIYRLKYQGSHDSHVKVAEETTFQWKYVKSALLDWQIYVSILVYWGIVCPLYGISLFLPTIIKSLGYASWKTQLLTIPIYITAAILAVIQAWASDRKKVRSPFIIFSLCLIGVGFLICICAPRHLPGLTYAGVFIATCGIYPAFPGNITWLSNNLAGKYKRNTGMALQIAIGNLGGAMASNFYRPQDSPRYLLGHGLELGFVVAGLLAAAVLVVNYKRINRKREREGTGNLTAEELSLLGDRSPSFRYVL